MDIPGGNEKVVRNGPFADRTSSSAMPISHSIYEQKKKQETFRFERLPSHNVFNSFCLDKNNL